MVNKLLVMKKIAIIICLFLGFLTVAFAQKRGYVQLTAGPSVPLGEFAKSVTGKQLAGLAGGGVAAEIIGGYRVFKDNLGVAVLLSYNQNEINQTNLLVQADQRLPASWKVKNVAQWKMTTALIGPYWRLQKGAFRMDIRALAGIARVVSPVFALTGTYLNRAANVETQSKAAQGFAFGMSGSLAYTIFGNVSACLNVSYLQSKITLVDVPSKTTIGSINAISLSTETLPVAVLNTSAGLRFSF